MTRRKRPGLALEALELWCALTLLITLAGGAAEPQKPSLQGTWQINPELTAQLMKDQQDQRRSGGSSGARGGRRGGGGGGMWGGRGGRGGPDQGDATADSTTDGDQDNGHQVGRLASLDSLTIVQQGSQITITDLDGHARTLKADGSKVKDEDERGGPAEVKTSWDKDGTLQVEVKPDKGNKRKESYSVSNDGKHLYLTLTMPRPRTSFGPDRKIIRAYDLAPAPEPAAAPAAPKPAEQPPSPPPPGAAVAPPASGAPPPTALRPPLR